MRALPQSPKGEEATTDLGARSLGIEEEEVSFGRQQWGMQRNTNCCSGVREGRRGSRLERLTHSLSARKLTKGEIDLGLGGAREGGRNRKG